MAYGGKYAEEYERENATGSLTDKYYSEMRAEGTVQKRIVISGHGAFEEKYLEKYKRKPISHFIVPKGVTLTFYAPDGAALENQVVKKIEAGENVTIDMVELKGKDSGQIEELPKPYPYKFIEDEKVINYTVMPPRDLRLAKETFFVKENTSLKKIVSHLKALGYTDIHYTCCSSSHSLNFRKLFPGFGFFVKKKIATHQ